MATIKKDTVWRAGETIVLKGTTHVAAGATLTIEPGAVIKGGTIKVSGKLVASGTKKANIVFDKVNFQFSSSHDTPGRIDIDFARFDKGSFLKSTGDGSYGSFGVANSTFKSVEGFYLWYPGSSSFLNNTFVNSSGIGIITHEDMVIKGNSFVTPAKQTHGSQKKAAIEVWAAHGNPIVIEHNTFSLPDNSLAIVVGNFSPVKAAQNYFGTTYSSVIAQMILDGKDDPGRDSIVDFQKFLTAPHSDAPPVSLYMRGGSKNDKLAGTSLDDVIYGKDGKDTLTGKGGKDKLYGGGSNDTLDGGSGADLLGGGTGADTMRGGTGSDTYIVNNKGDKVIEKAGGGKADLVKASISYTLPDHVENLTLTGSKAINGTGNGLANKIVGNSASNVLKGGGGGDALQGAGGADHLYGGAGKDTFVFKSVKDSTFAKAGRDTIHDFTTKGKAADQIDLTAIDANTKVKGNQAFDFIGTKAFSGKPGELRYEKKASDAYVYGDVNGDGKTDFAIHFDDALSFSKGHFLL